jgi:hypothetical protein
MLFTRMSRRLSSWPPFRELALSTLILPLFDLGLGCQLSPIHRARRPLGHDGEKLQMLKRGHGARQHAVTARQQPASG